MLRAGRVVALLQRSSKSLEEVTLAVKVHESAFSFFIILKSFTEQEQSLRAAGGQLPFSRCCGVSFVLQLSYTTCLEVLPPSYFDCTIHNHCQYDIFLF